MPIFEYLLSFQTISPKISLYMKQQQITGFGLLQWLSGEYSVGKKALNNISNRFHLNCNISLLTSSKWKVFQDPTIFNISFLIWENVIEHIPFFNLCRFLFKSTHYSCSNFKDIYLFIIMNINSQVSSTDCLGESVSVLSM